MKCVHDIISLGAGVQSTTMLLMALHGETKYMPQCAIFSDTHSVGIDKYVGIIFYSRLLTDRELKWANVMPCHVSLPINKILTSQERDQFAWMDGFRPAGATKENSTGAFDLMVTFWTTTHELPWAGDIIYWHPLLKPATIQ